MKKNEIILKVSDSLEWLDDIDAKFGVSAWYKPNGPMVDEHVTEYFDELNDIGLEEEAEGDMYYYGEDFSKEDMIQYLEEAGFTVEEYNGKNY